MPGVMHFCEAGCGQFGAFGLLCAGGQRWFCRAHLPADFFICRDAPTTAAGQQTAPAAAPRAPAGPRQGALL